MKLRKSIFAFDYLNWKHNIIFMLCVLIYDGECYGQENKFELPAIDTTFDSDIKTILFYKNTPEETFPFMTLGKGETLNLQFDLLEGSPVDLYYSIFHFDQNWMPDELLPEDYMKGFQEEQIKEFTSSRLTQISYIHYQLRLNSNLILLSGNYLICISDQNKNVFFTRRFYVSENNVIVSAKFLDPANAAIYRTHQALVLTLNTNKINIQNNTKELGIHIMQNGDPNSLQIRNLPNSNVGPIFYFNKTDDILFKGIKEFRPKDIRTLRSTTQDIWYWDEKKDYYHCWLMPDESRYYKSYLTESDINGRFITLNRESENATTESEYVMVHFTLNRKEALDEAVYIYGGLTDWQLKPEFLMEYDPSRQAYQGSALLKIGYYNFMYAIKDLNDSPNTSPLESDWYETENAYNILVYFRPFGSRYDRLLFAGEFNSNQ